MKRNSAYIMTKIIDPLNHAKPAQVGVDLTVKRVEEIIGHPRMIDSKLDGVAYRDAEMEGNSYILHPNSAYAVTFEQGLRTLDLNECATITQRSSLNRAGIRVQGSIYDPNFGCENLGATIYTSDNGIVLPVGTRIAQVLIETCESTDNPYNGRWQGKANA